MGRLRRVFTGSLGVALLIMFGTAVVLPAHAASKKARVLGTVVDEEQRPLSGVLVTATEGSETLHEATTDEEGKFSLKIADATRELVYRFEKEGYQPLETPLRVEPGKESDFTVTLPSSASWEAGQLFRQAAEELRAGRIAEAESKLLRVIELRPDLSPAHLTLAEIYLLQENFSAAAAQAEAFVDLQPDDRDGTAVLCGAYLGLGEAERVAPLMEVLRGTEEGKRLAVELHNHGAQASQKGDGEKAAAWFDAAVELDPDLTPAHAALATIHYNEQRFEEALASVEKVLAVEAENALALKIRYLAYNALGDGLHAEEAFTAYLAADEGGAVQDLYERGVALFEGGHVAAARGAFEQVLGIRPDHSRAHYQLGLTLLNSGDSAAAREHLRRFVELAPGDADAEAARRMLEQL